ncbi:glycerate kinase [Aneurinibacillus sp. BA2021]|nr:glycerate kinase [Aneurinibacillus sp. BA2021]
MKIVIAPDSFKGSLSAHEASLAMERGIKRVLPDAETVLVPVADGGEGTMDSLVAATKGRYVEHTVTGPLQTAVRASYGILGDGKTCVIEMASAAGLVLVPPAERNPLLTTTYGVGELIKEALDAGCRRFILGIGGSATNDGGSGMLQALGMKLLDEQGKAIGYGGGELSRIAVIDDREFDPRIARSEFLLAADVQNPLVGPQGASYVFGPQKGAGPELVARLDRYLHRWADIIEQKTGIRLHERPGAGAAGGIGGAFQAFFPSVMRRGIDIVIEHTGFIEKLSGASLVLTGEGQIDFQTASGKTPMGIAQAAQKQGIPVFAIAGSIGPGIDVLYQYGIHSIHSMVNAPMPLQEAMEKAAELLEDTTEQVLRTYLASPGAGRVC